jgi:hypothetical protein
MNQHLRSMIGSAITLAWHNRAQEAEQQALAALDVALWGQQQPQPRQRTLAVSFDHLVGAGEQLWRDF